ncbi:hypothetical protein D6201_05440 [Aurantiacibacter aquimixticola]|uniref:Uncharacterized protein n=2 Tax=Aurantiacibacter aquimixticola TaxID=1958945 RepID=A0A419RWT0_9SPHN|nr:hypothetical protein D6201_05440 [Aurantiacibacter aquimixticola]
MLRPVLPLLLLAVASPLWARDSLGVFGQWGAFAEPERQRCYAIATADESRARRDFQPYASVGTWPRRNVRSQVHFRLSRELAERANVRLAIGGARFDLIAGEGDAWATSASEDAAIVTAMRAAGRMSIRATDNRGNRFSDYYNLDGAATAIDAANVGCTRRE